MELPGFMHLDRLKANRDELAGIGEAEILSIKVWASRINVPPATSI